MSLFTPPLPISWLRRLASVRRRPMVFWTWIGAGLAVVIAIELVAIAVVRSGGQPGSTAVDRSALASTPVAHSGGEAMPASRRDAATLRKWKGAHAVTTLIDRDRLLAGLRKTFVVDEHRVAGLETTYQVEGSAWLIVTYASSREHNVVQISLQTAIENDMEKKVSALLLAVVAKELLPTLADVPPVLHWNAAAILHLEPWTYDAPGNVTFTLRELTISKSIIVDITVTDAGRPKEM